MTDEADARKRRVREAVRAQRSERSEAARDRAAVALSAHLTTLVTQSGARRITCYLPTPGEPDTSQFLQWALSHGIEVLLPISQADRTLAWAYHSAAPPEVGLHGIHEPAGPRLPASAAGTADLMLIPACAVDNSGTRLGWGLGYYDRCLAALDPAPPVYAVVFAEEILPSLPRDPHDVPVMGAVTPAGIRSFHIQTR